MYESLLSGRNLNFCHYYVNVLLYALYFLPNRKKVQMPPRSYLKGLFKQKVCTLEHFYLKYKIVCKLEHSTKTEYQLTLNQNQMKLPQPLSNLK